MTPAVLEKIDSVRTKTAGIPRLTYTELARGKAWRAQLPECGVMEVTDKGETSAFLLSGDYMYALVSLLDEVASEYEQGQIDQMLAVRANYQNWQQGEQLAVDALASFEARKADFRNIADGNI